MLLVFRPLDALVDMKPFDMTDPFKRHLSNISGTLYSPPCWVCFPPGFGFVFQPLLNSKPHPEVLTVPVPWLWPSGLFDITVWALINILLTLCGLFFVAFLPLTGSCLSVEAWTLDWLGVVKKWRNSGWDIAVGVETSWFMAGSELRLRGERKEKQDFQQVYAIKLNIFFISPAWGMMEALGMLLAFVWMRPLLVPMPTQRAQAKKLNMAQILQQCNMTLSRQVLCRPVAVFLLFFLWPKTEWLLPYPKQHTTIRL